MSANWDVIVLGAGPEGLTASWSLAESGLKILLLEKEAVADGSCRGDDLEGARYGRTTCDISPQDRHLLELCAELGLGPLEFRKLPLGSFSGDQWRRANHIPLALATLFRGKFQALSLLKPLAPLGWDSQKAAPWLTDTFGNFSQRSLFPILQKQFGGLFQDVSLMAFYGRFSHHFSALSLLGGSIKRAAFTGGPGVLCDALAAFGRRAGAACRLGSPVLRLEPQESGWKVILGSHENPETLTARNVLSTLALPTALNLLPSVMSAGLPQRAVRHLDSAVVRILASRRVTPFYSCLLPEAGIPFSRITEETLLRPHPKGYSVLFLEKNAPPGALESEKTLEDEALRFLANIPNPIHREEILRLDVFQSAENLPLFDCDYLGKLPRHRSPWKGLYFCDNSQLFPSGPGLNAAVSQARRVARLVIDDFRAKR